MTATFDPPLPLNQPGVHALQIVSAGPPGGFNHYGFALGDSVRGGEWLGPTMGSEVELLFRLRGSGGPGAFSPPDFMVPALGGPVVSSYYSTIIQRNVTQFTYSWPTLPGAAYEIWGSSDMISWQRKSTRLGDGSSVSYTMNDISESTQFLRVGVLPLGDLVK